jgi:hypothetical protein
MQTGSNRRLLVMAVCAIVTLHMACRCGAADSCLGSGVAPNFVVDQSGARGLMSWRPVAGAQGYRVRIVRQVPEGAQVDVADSLTIVPEFRWSLRPHARPTKLRYSVQVRCPQGEGAPSAGQAILEPSSGCDPIELHSSPAPGSPARTLSWSASPGMQTEVAEYDRAGGLVLRSLLLADSHTLAVAAGTRMVMLRRVCGAVAGAPLFYLFP